MENQAFYSQTQSFRSHLEGITHQSAQRLRNSRGTIYFYIKERYLQRRCWDRIWIFVKTYTGIFNKYIIFIPFYMIAVCVCLSQFSFLFNLILLKLLSLGYFRHSVKSNALNGLSLNSSILYAHQLIPPGKVA